MAKFLTHLTLLLIVASCQTSESNKTVEIHILNDRQSIVEFNDLNLDVRYPNLLNPQVSGASYDQVVQSWSELHKTIGDRLEERGFSWDSRVRNVEIMSKIYFKENSEIRHYAYRILGNNLPSGKKNEFQSHIQEILPEIKISLKRSSQFAQCGIVEYRVF